MFLLRNLSQTRVRVQPSVVLTKRMVILYLARPPTRPVRNPDVQPLGSVRLPLPSSRRPDRRRHRARQHGPRDVRPRRPCRPAAGSTPIPNRRRSPPGSTPSSAPARARSSRSSARRRRARTRRPPSSRAPSRRRPPACRPCPRSTGIVGYAETGDTRFISTAGDAAYIVVELNVTDEAVGRRRRPDPRGDRAAGRLHATS